MQSIFMSNLTHTPYLQILISKILWNKTLVSFLFKTLTKSLMTELSHTKQIFI